MIKQDPKNPKVWIVSFGKRHPITRQSVTLRRKAATASEAKRVYLQLVIDVEEKIRGKIVPTWKDSIDRYLDDCTKRGLSEKTVEDYGLCLRAHTLSEWQTRLVDTITTAEIRDLMIRKLKSRSVSQQKGVLKMIRGVFNHAVEAGVCSRNPTPQLSFKAGDKIKHVLSKHQASALLNRSREFGCEWYPHWAMAIYTGMRNGELYALTWDKVNLDTSKIKVDTAWNNRDGFKSTKSGDDRMVDVAPPLLSLLRRWKLERSDSVFVLPRLRKWDAGEQARELRMFMMGVGMNPISFHALRATWATLMLSGGVAPIKVMSMGGWKDLKTMMIYARKAGVDIEGIASVLHDLHSPYLETATVIKFEQS